MERLLKTLKGPVGLALASAILYTLSLPPFNLGLLVFVALVPWLVGLRTLTGRQAFRNGYLFGFVLWGTQMSWVVSLTKSWVGNAALGLLPLLVCCVLGAFYFAVLGFTIQRAFTRQWIWAIPLLWAGMEVIRSFIPGLAYPYFLISTPLWSYPMLIQSAFFGTQYLISAWVVAINVLTMVWLMYPVLISDESNVYAQFNQLRRILVPTLAILVISLVRWIQPVEGSAKKVTAGQPGVDLAFSKPEDEARLLYNNVTFLYARAREERSELLVLPEGVAIAVNDQPPTPPFTVQASPPVLFGGRRFILTGSIPPITEEVLSQSNKVYQSAFGFDTEWKFADKARIVVFGEYVPGRGVIPFLDKFQLPSGDITPSDKTSALDIGGLKVGPLVCFEGLFFDVAHQQTLNKAQILAVIAIDDWYMGTGAPDQLRTAAVWRAVETGLPVVRSGGLGYSMIIDQLGRVLKEAPLGKTVAITSTVYVPKEAIQFPIRPFVAWGLATAFGVLSLVLFRKQSTSKPA